MTKSEINIGSIKIDIDETSNHVVYKISGMVDESFKQDQVPRIKAQTIVLDLEGLKNFNSCGVREWVFLIRDLEKYGQLRFKNCSIPMVDQLNMVPESAGNGIIESFYAPYACESHGESEYLITLNNDFHDIQAGIAPDVNCTTCQKPLIFDAMVDSYFLFLTAAKTKKKAS